MNDQESNTSKKTYRRQLREFANRIGFDFKVDLISITGDDVFIHGDVKRSQSIDEVIHIRLTLTTYNFLAIMGSNMKEYSDAVSVNTSINRRSVVLEYPDGFYSYEV